MNSNKKKRCFPKKLECSRCPWCGEEYDTELCDTAKTDDTILFCDKCAKYGKQNYKWKMRILIVVWLCFLVFATSHNKAPVGFYYMIAVVLPTMVIHMIIAALYKNTPVYRYHMEYKNIFHNEFLLCHANIEWYSLHKGGIGFPKFRIWNGMTFPVCFVDDNDIPVSQVGVVRFVKRYGLFWKGAELLLITDFIKEDEVKEGQKFYIFSARERIGEGVVTYNGNGVALRFLQIHDIIISCLRDKKGICEESKNAKRTIGNVFRRIMGVVSHSPCCT